jgi:hypothetical protein
MLDTFFDIFEILLPTILLFVENKINKIKKIFNCNKNLIRIIMFTLMIMRNLYKYIILNITTEEVNIILKTISIFINILFTLYNYHKLKN